MAAESTLPAISLNFKSVYFGAVVSIPAICSLVYSMVSQCNS
ncbi:Uncharacterized protein YP598_4317 (plasmid) [Yersinia pseudotuberculosis]|nr:Uncharacterized protein YP598_4317 [Yersinia pseudotuberculosis]